MNLSETPSAAPVVKKCPKCGAGLTLEQALAGRELSPIGMGLLGGRADSNAFYFNHSCGTTVTLPVSLFVPFISEWVSAEILAGSPRCERHCLSVDDLRTCDQPCSYAPFRRFLVHRLLAHRAPSQEPSLRA